MEQKKIIIVGASSGLGRHLAIKYAAQGHPVAITGRRLELLRTVQSAFPQQIIISCFDVMQEHGIAAVKSLVDQLGGLDLFIYNAGFGEPSEQLDWENEKTTVLTNVVGCVQLVNFAFNYFINKGSGQIAITSSVSALRGNSWAPAYSASKAFVSNYAEGLNMKAGKLKKDIVVTELRPGFVNTKMAKGNKRFWVASPEKAAVQMIAAIERKKRLAYITKRWEIIGTLMKFLPHFLYRRIG